MSALLSAATAERYATTLHGVVDTLAERFATTTQPFSGASREQLEQLVDAVDLDTAGEGTQAALDEIGDLYLRHAVWFHDPAYTAHLNCPVALPAVAAEAVLAAVNTSVDTYDQSTVGTLMERRLVEWTARRIGYAQGDGVFTSGGTQSNLQALFLARESALRALGAAEGEARTAATARLRVLATASSHFSVGKSALLLGLAHDAVVEVPADASGRMDPASLSVVLHDVAAAGQHVMAVVATAGTTDRGCIDPLDAIADACDPTGAWLHVDAAYGCGLLVSPTRRHLLAGVERSRSVTVDFHKSFFQPVSSSALVVREPADLAPVAWHADYLNPLANAEPNQVDKSLQTTRRFDALKLWVTLRALGPDGVGRMVDAVCDLAAQVHAALADDPDLHVVAPTQLSTVLFRYEPAGLDPARADAIVPAVRRLLFDSGRAIVTKTVIDGRPCLKLTLLNPDSRLEDVLRVLELVRTTAQVLADPDRLLDGAGVLDLEASR
ncbi:L-2,4-diaminobutyrate decarboxylase [Sediminihabitans luteus]|uniref:L-2,4-diaminobutyrate decarboxylase n=1 Tax=Sediminihabitans luteus TaxID=1138585 RepID=A0A2M9CQS8_9CELL|nr:pyridoxal-dependent decarboxylase [Sediminihabitans luteus]PJJ74282.1 L-2,4-diaminobutyrate decarboxylase [Sediminihabitans luteus]GII99135.1 pyridoxal-dependent decarboxylase [Sediminihabitans luteus]